MFKDLAKSKVRQALLGLLLVQSCLMIFFTNCSRQGFDSHSTTSSSESMSSPSPSPDPNSSSTPDPSSPHIVTSAPEVPRWTESRITEATYSNSVNLDHQGNILTGGDVCNATGTDCQSYLFVAKHNSTGQLLWKIKFGYPDNSQASPHLKVVGVASDSSNNFFAVISTIDGISIQSKTAAGKGNFLIQISPQGQVLSINLLSYKNTPISAAEAIAIDASNHIVLAGRSYTDTGGFLASCSTDGTCPVFVKTDKALSAVAIDTNGDFVVSGDLQTGTIPGTNLASYKAAISKYDNAGVLLWSQFLGTGQSSDEATSLSIDTQGNIYASGYTSEGLNGNQMNSKQDGFLAKLDPTGHLVWVKQSGDVNSFRFVRTDQHDNVYASGRCVFPESIGNRPRMGIEFIKYDPTSGLVLETTKFAALNHGYVANTGIISSDNHLILSGYVADPPAISTSDPLLQAWIFNMELH